MKNFDSMNSLSEEDKSLETIEYLIYFIKTHRADSIKEALHEYDKLQTNKQMLEIERQKLEANLKKAALEHEDRMKQLEAEKMHNYEMECLSRDNARSRQEIAKNLDFISYQIHYK